MAAQNSPLQFQVEINDENASSQDSRKQTWLFRGFGFAGLMLIGVSVWAFSSLLSYADPHYASGEPAGHVPAFGFIPIVPGIRPGGFLLVRTAGALLNPPKAGSTADVKTTPLRRDVATDWRDDPSLPFAFSDAEAPAPPNVNLGLTNIIEAWMTEAKREEEGEFLDMAFMAQDTTWKAKMVRTQNVLDIMRSRIDTGSRNAPAQVFGLAYQDYEFSDQSVRPDSIQVMATLSYGSIKDFTGYLYSLGRGFGGDNVMRSGSAGENGYVARYEVVNVDQIIATPFLTTLTEIHSDSVGELLYQIVDWAALHEKMVTVTPETDEEQAYYESIGFEFFGEVNQDWTMVYGLRIPTSQEKNKAGMLVDLEF